MGYSCTSAPPLPLLALSCSSNKHIMTCICRVDPVKASQAAREAGTLIFVIGVGSGVDESSLTAIAGAADHVLHVDDFDKLRTIQYELLRKVCA